MNEIIDYCLAGLFLVVISLGTIYGAKAVGESLGECMYGWYKK